MTVLSNLKTKPKIYLAGPMDGCTQYEMKNWREAVKLLWGEDNVYDPSVRDYTGRVAELLYEECKYIVESDLADIRKSDIVLANCWKRSYGTVMELVYAKQYGKYIYVVMPEKEISPFIRVHADYITNNLYDAMEEINKWTR